MVQSLPNRPVRTRMPGGVGGGSCEASPYPDQGQARSEAESDVPGLDRSLLPSSERAK